MTVQQLFKAWRPEVQNLEICGQKITTWIESVNYLSTGSKHEFHQNKKVKICCWNCSILLSFWEHCIDILLNLPLNHGISPHKTYEFHHKDMVSGARYIKSSFSTQALFKSHVRIALSFSFWDVAFVWIYHKNMAFHHTKQRVNKDRYFCCSVKGTSRVAFPQTIFKSVVRNARSRLVFETLTFFWTCHKNMALLHTKLVSFALKRW